MSDENENSPKLVFGDLGLGQSVTVVLEKSVAAGSGESKFGEWQLWSGSVENTTVHEGRGKEEKLVKEAETLAKALEGLTIKIGAKAGTSGKIFGSVNALQLAEALKEQHKYDIDRKKIKVDGELIKELGNYIAKINIHKEISADINFEVFAE